MKAVRTYASNILNYTVNLKIIADNPFNYTKAPRKKEASKAPSLKYYSSDELKQFLSFVKDDPLY